MFRKNKLLKNNRKNNNYNGRSSARIDVIEIYNSRVNYINEEDWSEIVAQLSHNPFHYKFYSKISNITSLICKKTKLHQMVTSTAMVFFHKFYLVNIHNFNSFSPIELIAISASCILIASKFTYNLIHLDTIISKICELKTSVDKSQLKNKILQFEFSVLSSCGFDFSIELPYKWIKRLKNKITQNLNTNQFATLWMYILNDTFTLPLCLRFTSATIAMASFVIAIEKIKLSIDVLNVIEENKIEVSISEMKQCVYLINKYIYNKQNDIEIKENYSKEVNRYHTEISI